MKRIAIIGLLALACWLPSNKLSGDEPAERGKPSRTIAWPANLPVYDHVVVVVEENKDFDQIIDNPKAPFINFTLREEGANFTQMYGEEHNSEGNYFWLFSGSNQSVGFKDVIPTKENNPNYPFTAPNLGAALLAKKLLFKGYSEDLPEIGSKVEYTKSAAGEKIYARKHVPWISFDNIPNGNTIETSCNLRFSDFPRDLANFASLPKVAFVIPNLQDDMHNGKPRHSIPKGDAWLAKNLGAYYAWAKTHNSLLIVTFDESDNKTNYLGLTNPFVLPTKQFKRDLQNRIPTIFAGAHIKVGDYPEARGITHVNILRTLEAMYELPMSGDQQPNALGRGISNTFIITDIFEPAK
jgi:phosphatidylinositol-3-phosphatase